jgi:hypothetical protein
LEQFGSTRKSVAGNGAWLCFVEGVGFGSLWAILGYELVVLYLLASGLTDYDS